MTIHICIYTRCYLSYNLVDNPISWRNSLWSNSPAPGAIRRVTLRAVLRAGGRLSRTCHHLSGWYTGPWAACILDKDWWRHTRIWRYLKIFWYDSYMVVGWWWVTLWFDYGHGFWTLLTWIWVKVWRHNGTLPATQWRLSFDRLCRNPTWLGFFLGGCNSKKWPHCKWHVIHKNSRCCKITIPIRISGSENEAGAYKTVFCGDVLIFLEI